MFGDSRLGVGGGLGMTASILPLPGKEPREGAGDTWPDGKTSWNATEI